MISDRADRRGACDESILVVMPAVIIEVGQKTELAGVTLPEQVLAKNVGHVNLLVAPFKLVEVGVGILLQHVERGDVVLPAIVVVVAEDSNAKVGVVENKSAEIA